MYDTSLTPKEVVDGDLGNKTLEVSDCGREAASQLWQFNNNEDGTYQIVNVGTMPYSKCLAWDKLYGGDGEDLLEVKTNDTVNNFEWGVDSTL